MHIDFGHGYYDGGVNEDEFPHGKGVITYYEPGTKTPGCKVEAEFCHGEFVGDVTVDYCNGAVYVGKYDRLEGNRIGYGVMKYNDGARYEGEWKDNMRDGQGTITFLDGEKYIGSWKEDNRHGSGSIYFSSGNIYMGNWKDNYMHGNGTFYYSNGDYYKGDFEMDYFHGKGTMYFVDGGKYVGEFKNDKFNGEGTLYDKDKKIIHKGTFKDGVFVGKKDLK